MLIQAVCLGPFDGADFVRRSYHRRVPPGGDILAGVNPPRRGLGAEPRGPNDEARGRHAHGPRARVCWESVSW